ncbi:Membrane alanyl aminopeptidase [Eumeta japonica]|uniref:Aminopeptidase n=1 Tax=Eumeta variegata TaxID=151549 RepID=A0A4C1W5Z9_EUMVA|nr:Membrane alanyl aminopeptidase [Eumeta japonica]
MATIIFVALSALLICVGATPTTLSSPVSMNTIFLDETLPGETFHNMNALQEATRADSRQESYRLPTTTRPVRYDLTVKIDVPNFRIDGVVEITLRATQANVNTIVIHSNQLNIRNMALRLATANVPVTFEEDEVHHFLIITLTTGTLQFSATSPVDYVLRIEYDAEMRDDMYGIYRSWYREGTQTRWMATTQFQATSARQAFPCYDEPSFKATFGISIIRPIGFYSWSCMRIQNTVNDETGFQRDIYFDTPVMSTYLIAMIVADYESLEVRNNNGLLIYEVIARRDAINAGQGEYALTVGQDLLSMMNTHTGIDFYSINPNLKMTQASIPDFSAGAMENWGLLTYREAYLMLDDNHTDNNFRQIIAYILSHEIAHMWFGNLVTCEWWDVLWLNEGFARYYQYFLTHWVETDMGFETRFIPEQVHTSLLSDSVITAHPLTNPGIGSPSAISNMFSTISYNKGAAIIRMTEHLLGFEVHRRGLHRYLETRFFNVAEPIHLFEALQTIADTSGAISQYEDFSVVDYYRTWTEQAGHPVLLVEVNRQTGDMTIQQRRFDVNTGFATANSNWIIPITFATASNPDFSNTKPTHIIYNSVTTINAGFTGNDWVIFNKQQTGFYRVMYDDYTWNLITVALRGEGRTLIHEYNRAQIVNDVFSFARAGLMTYRRAFNILSFLQEETAYAPWAAAVTGYNWLRNRYIGNPIVSDLEDLMVSWSTRVMQEIGYEPAANETFMQAYLRMQLAPVMCNHGVELCRTTARRLFLGLRNNQEVPVNIRRWVYCNGLRDGDESDYDFLWGRHVAHPVYTEKIVMQLNLGCTPFASRLNNYMDAITQNNELIRPQDYTNAWSSAVSGNEGNTMIALHFNSYSTPLSYIASRLRTEQQVNEYQQWIEARRDIFGDAYNVIYNAAENQRQSIRWAQEHAADINEYIVSGNDQIDVTTEGTTTTTTPTTVTPASIDTPTTPDLSQVPDSAAGVYASVVLMLAAVVAHLL